MKKLIYILAAAAAILSGCSKEQIAAPEPAAPVDIPDCSFFGEFALNKETKTTMLPGDNKYYVVWEQGDIIKVTAEGTGSTWEFAAESDGETAIFNVSGKTEEELATFFAASSFTATFGSDATPITIEKNNVKHLSMAASCGSDRVLTFNVDKPVLAVEIPASVSAKSLSVNPRGSNDPVVSLTCSEAVPVFYVPVPEDTKQYDIHAYSGENRTNEIAESMKMQGSYSMTKGNIYPFEFTPTLEITDAGNYVLKSYPANYKVHILEENTGDTPVNIAYETGAAKHPVNVYIDANGHDTDSLNVTTPDSHVEIEDGVSANVTSNTSKNTLVVKESFVISEKLYVEAGSVTAEGNNDGTKNVKEIVLNYPNEEAMKGVIVYLSDVTSGAPVIITNKTTSTGKEPITVCGKEETTSMTDGGYKITNNQSQNIQKLETVAAKIGDVVYPTILAAVEAAADGATITVIDDNTSTGLITIPAEKSLTLDLNGKTVTTVGNDKGIWSEVYGNLTIVGDGYLGDPTHSVTCYLFYAFGTLTFDSPAKFESGLEVVETRASEAKVYVKQGYYVGDMYDGRYWTFNKLDSAKDALIEVSGGTFENFNPASSQTEAPAENWVKSGYESVALGTTPETWTVLKSASAGVAKIGNKTYDSLVDAIADVPTDGTETTIQMIGNEDFGEFTGNKVVIPGTVNVVLDLNGQTISGTGNGGVASYLIHNKGILKIVDNAGDGKITYSSTTPDPSWGYGTSTILNRGTLEIASGNVVNTTKNGASYAVDNQTQWYDDFAVVTFTLNGTANINCTTGDAALRQCIALGGYTKQGETIVNNVNINGGTITGDIWVQVLHTASYGNLSITDGVITGKVYNNSGDVTNVAYSISGGRFNKKITLQGKQNFISGGFFTTDAKEETPATALASGKAFVASTAPDASTYPWTIGEAAKVAKVGTTEYSDLHEALEAAKTVGKTCELLSNVDLNGVTWTPITEFAGTLDGKGYTISNLTVNGGSCIGLIGSAPENGGGFVKNLTITNANIIGTGDKVAVVFGSAFRAIIENVTVTNSTVTTSGEYAGAITGGVYTTIKDCVVSGCSITGKEQVGGVIGYLCGEDMTGCKGINNKVIATDARAGGLVGKIQLADKGSCMYFENNTVERGTVTAPDNVGGLAGQMMGQSGYDNLYYVRNNTVDITLETNGTHSNPIANLREEVCENFTNFIASNIINNTWTLSTYNSNSYTYTYGGINQTIYNGTKPENVAKIGTTTYNSLADALKAASSVATIEILDGVWGPAAVGSLTTAEALQVRYKSLTIQPAAGANPTFTSVVYFGYNDSGTANATITVKNLKFVNAQLCVSNYVQATIEGCTFKNSDKTDATLLIRDACCTTKKSSGTYPASQVTVKDCVVDGSNVDASGIRIVNSGNVSITGTTVKNSLFNGILFESNSSVDNTAAKVVTITGNNLTNWNAGNQSEKGRALRMAMGTMASGSTITVEKNVFEKAALGNDKPDFVKITEAANATISLENNYWNGMSVADFSGKSDYYTVNGSSPAITSVKATK